MKKFFVAAFAMVAMSLSLISCGSKAAGFQEDQLKAMQNGDIEAYCEAIKAEAEYVGSLKKDEKEAYDKEVKEWEIDNDAAIKKAELAWKDACKDMSPKDQEALSKAIQDAAKLANGEDPDEKKD